MVQNPVSVTLRPLLCFFWLWPGPAKESAEGGIPIGAAVFKRDGSLAGLGHNRRIQDGDPSMHRGNERIS